MAYFKSLPRSCKIERKEFVLLLDKYAKHTHYWLTETGAHKAFSIEVSPRDLYWIRSTLKSLIETPSSNRFFLENRDSEHCIWIRKTRNGKGCTAEIFRVDHKNRKSCILVPEGPEKSGWVSFLSMITPKVEITTNANMQRQSLKEDLPFLVTQATLMPQTIQVNLQETNRGIFYIPCLHAEKALVHFNSNVPANLLCQNKGWTTVGKYTVRFEKWAPASHASPKLIPSYGGWTTFRGIPLHLWNMMTFQQIGKACGSLVKVAEETKTARNQIEAKLKIRYNYSGFLPAYVKIFDQEGNKFVVQVVTHSEGKWLMERNVRLHGTFKRQAAASFDDFNPDAEQFLFDGLEAISPDLLNTISGSRKSISPEQQSALKSVIIKPARDATSPTTLNEEVVNDNSLHATTINSKLKILSGISNDGSLDKGKQKVDIPSQLTSAFIFDKPKRKVSFNSPNNKTTFFNPDSAPANHSPLLSSPEKKQRVSRERSVKKKSLTIQPKSRANQGKGDLITQPLQVVAHDLDASKKGLSLTVDLGNLPALDPSKSCEDHHSSDNAEVIDITNTEVVTETPELKMTDPKKSNSSPEVNYRKQKHSHRRRHYYRKKEGKEKDTNSEAFKNQLVTWLKENGLKLSTDTDSSGATTSTNALFSQLGSRLDPKGDGAPGTSNVI
ncbi:hypothetical protein E6C27_scaffold274G004110 [Cucumis melo var. makuwa]|uniref:Uncharacterized protein n=1 Tax=Cucumis melo var. makuwa TaxID=1194695 RepID=A0A5A7UQG0_CUCMM|nr:hypothetical protein E6C27_scaffold274G004110 [Cucumis melo var. makuwa]